MVCKYSADMGNGFHWNQWASGCAMVSEILHWDNEYKDWEVQFPVGGSAEQQLQFSFMHNNNYYIFFNIYLNHENDK